jgi:hypothetical protein
MDERSDGMITRRKRGGGTEEVRPTFNWQPQDEKGFHETESCIGQLTEDVRNVLEEIRDKQMLQCDVRAMIQSLLNETRRTRRVLEAAFGRKRKKRKKAAAKA